MTTLLIDGDTLAYLAALSAERVVDWGDTVSKYADKAEAIAHYEASIANLLTLYDTTKHRVALTDRTNFRKAILPTYKSKRGEKPMALAAVRDHAEHIMGAFVRDGLEGDDVLGIWSTHPTLIPGRKIIVSIDKDMRTIPGLLSIGDGVVETMTTSTANYCHMHQTLTGDQTDGYTGLPGCGPKGASKILMDFVDEKGGFHTVPAWAAVVAAYEHKGLTEADALVQARVARILRYTDYNFKTKEVIPWQPPSQS